MHVIWKRPDGFHGAEPEDFRSVEIEGRAKIWLHKSDHSNFPFRISGGWQETEATTRLNHLINLIGSDDKNWVDCLSTIYNDSMKDEPEKFLSETTRWLGDLRGHLKGDTWEVDIMNQVISTVIDRIGDVAGDFTSSSK